jgi:hypothetical protein
MSTDHESDAVLRDELTDTIEALSENRHRANCPAHSAVVDGIILLLRCQRARLAQTRAIATGAIAAAVGATIAGAAIVVCRYYGLA